MRMNTPIHIKRNDPDYPWLEVNSETIGTCHIGCEGSDQYVRFWSDEDDINPDEIHNAVLPLVYRQTHSPGTYFCTSMRAFQTENSNEVICVIQHRYDV
jgi:hypothetical protein